MSQLLISTIRPKISNYEGPGVHYKVYAAQLIWWLVVHWKYVVFAGNSVSLLTSCQSVQLFCDIACSDCNLHTPYILHICPFMCYSIMVHYTDVTRAYVSLLTNIWSIQSKYHVMESGWHATCYPDQFQTEERIEDS